MTRAADKAYERIRASILSGAYPPGSHLKEEQIAEETGVSRTPVREALRRLSSEQLVTFVSNRGAYVTSWSPADVAEVYELRSMLEGYAAARAATRITEAELDTLAQLAGAIEALSEERSAENHVRMLELNQQLHTTIIDAADSERLRVLLSWLVEMPMLLKTYEKFDDQEIARSNSHHRELIAAFRAADPDWARTVMETHLRAAYRVYASRAEAPKPRAARTEALRAAS